MRGFCDNKNHWIFFSWKPPVQIHLTDRSFPPPVVWWKLQEVTHRTGETRSRIVQVDHWHSVQPRCGRAKFFFRPSWAQNLPRFFWRIWFDFPKYFQSKGKNPVFFWCFLDKLLGILNISRNYAPRVFVKAASRQAYIGSFVAVEMIRPFPPTHVCLDGISVDRNGFMSTLTLDYSFCEQYDFWRYDSIWCTYTY